MHRRPTLRWKVPRVAIRPRNPPGQVNHCCTGLAAEIAPVWVSRRGGLQMSGKTWLGVALIVLGVVALAYRGFSYTTPKKELDLGPVQVTKEEKHNVPLPPILGGL